MAQHDYVIDNQAFPATRADINSVLQAIVSNNSGSSAPSTTFANQIWYDSSANILYMRNEDNDANIPLLQLDQSADVASTLATIIDILDASGTNTAGTDLTIRAGAGTGTGAGGKIILQTADGGSSGSSVNSHATAVTIADDGNVGVGVTAPDTPLEVQIGSSGNALKLSSSADGASVFLAFEHQESGTKHVRGRIRAASNGVEGGLIFETGASSSTSERLRIDNDGNVGVGISSSLQKFTVNNSSSGIVGRFTNNTNQTLDLGVVSGSGSAGAVFYDSANSGTQDFRIGGTRMMRLMSTGELCVGTSGTSGKVFIEATGSTKPCVFSLASNTSYTGVIHRMRCATASGSGFFPIFIESGNGSDTEFYVRGDGEVRADGSFVGGGADYAEMFEWADGNSDNEDRRGYSVVLTDGNKIRKATSDDAAADIIGIVSASPMVVGDTQSMKWEGKYLKDDFGNYIYENYTVTNWTEGETKHSYETDKIPSDVTVPEDAVVSDKDDNGNELKRRKLNPEYDDTETYIPRDERQEWGAIGMVGKLRMRSGQPTGDRWIKMRDVASGVEEWLVR
jgi:hypothetical protein